MADASSFLPAGDHTAMIPPQFLSCFTLGGGVQEGWHGARVEQQMTGHSPAAGTGGGCAFTASQLEELQVQELIYKYLVMGVPVPQELLLSVHRSLEAMDVRLYHPHPSPAVGDYSHFGKKFDPEPGRCRRTDGKKWRCSKNAYPNSKYCERHMHRGRNRSRKLVEQPPVPQAQFPTAAAGSSVAEYLAPLVNNGSGSQMSQSIQMHSLANSQDPFSVAHVESASPDINSKEFMSFPYEVKPELGYGIFLSESSGSTRRQGTESNQLWGAMPSQMFLFPLSKMDDGSAPGDGYPQLSPIDNLGPATMSLLPKDGQVACSLCGNQLGAVEPVKQSHSLQPSMNEWPKTRASWTELEDGSSSGLNSYFFTDLSISVPMAGNL